MKAATAFATLFLLACQAQGPTDAAVTGDSGAQGLDAPTPPLLAIGQVQGHGPRSPLVDQQVTIQGVVVGNFSKGLQGVFVQSERDDGDPATSEGIFVVHHADAEPTLHTGDRVRVSGRVVEEGDDRGPLTALRDVVIEVIGASGVRSTELDKAPESAADWERYEGMALRITAPLTVSDNRGLTRYGEITASFDGRLFQPTEIAIPGAAAEKVSEDNARRTLLLDDNRTSKDPRNLWFLKHELDDKRPLRAGSRLLNVSGVLDQRRGEYRLQLTEKLEVRQAPRPSAPTVPGDLRIVSMNMLNLFNGDGHGGGFPTERGADSFEQYQRQQQKLVAVVQALAPDVAALMEVENDGSGSDSTLAQFVAALNTAGPARDYRLIDSGDRLGSDAIHVAMIYRAGRVAPQGRAVSLTGGPFASRSRVPLAQAFRVGSGPVFVIAANHFKSKSCAHDDDKAKGADADQHDGQSCWNAVRVTSSDQLLEWLASNPTGHPGAPQLIIGDLNAHAMEDPIRRLQEAGWQDAFALVEAPHPYSFVFDGQAGRLDHALLNAPMAARLRGAVEWHNNSDETEFFDYHQDQEGDPYRASDHDPILLGFDLGRQQL
jgi:predicted extracellular nuclease